MEISEIKKHNQNVKDIVKFLNEKCEKKYNLKDFGYISSLSTMIFAEKNLIKAYNEMISKYNTLVLASNIIIGSINEDLAKTKACNKRVNDLNKQLKKLNLIAENIEKPEDYKLCLSLRDQREQILKETNATKTETIIETKEKIVETTDLIGKVWSTKTEIKEYEEPVEIEEPDEERRKVAREKLKEIDEIIKNQPNYEKCLLIEKFENDKKILGYAIQDVKEFFKKVKNRIDNGLKLKESDDEILNDFRKLITIQFDLINKNISKQKLEKMELEEISSLIKVEQKDTAENMITYTIKHDIDYNGDDCSLVRWKKCVNEYIDCFGIKTVEKNEIKKSEQDYTTSYDDDYLYDEENYSY